MQDLYCILELQQRKLFVYLLHLEQDRLYYAQNVGVYRIDADLLG